MENKMHHQNIDTQANTKYGIPSRGDDRKVKSLYEQYLRTAVVPQGYSTQID